MAQWITGAAPLMRRFDELAGLIVFFEHTIELCWSLCRFF